MTTRQVIRVENRMDRWRYTCPRGHRTWEPTNHHFWCERCASAENVDGAFDQLRDKVTGELFARDEVLLLTETGPLNADLDTEGSA